MTRDAVIVAVSTAMPQSVGRAAGRIGEAQLGRIRRICETRAHRDRAIVLVQHHGPEGFGLPRRIFDGLVDEGALRAVMQAHKNVHVLCGHTHRATDRALGALTSARIFTAPAVMTHPSPVRVYEATAARLRPLEGEAGIARRDVGRTLFGALTDVAPSF